MYKKLWLLLVNFFLVPQIFEGCTGQFVTLKFGNLLDTPFFFLTVNNNTISHHFRKTTTLNLKWFSQHGFSHDPFVKQYPVWK